VGRGAGQMLAVFIVKLLLLSLVSAYDLTVNVLLINQLSYMSLCFVVGLPEELNQNKHHTLPGVYDSNPRCILLVTIKLACGTLGSRWSASVVARRSLSVATLSA